MENNILLTSTIWHYGYLTSSGIVEGTSTSLNSYSDLIDCDGYDTLTILAAVWRTIQPCCLFYKEDGSIAGTFQFDMDASQSVTNARIYEIDIPEDAKTFRTTCLNDQRIWYNSVKCYFKLLTYGGANVQMRIYPGLSNENEAHHFEINPNNCITNFTNSKGESLSNVPKVYVEILRFWRRNE